VVIRVLSLVKGSCHPHEAYAKPASGIAGASSCSCQLNPGHPLVLLSGDVVLIDLSLIAAVVRALAAATMMAGGFCFLVGSRPGCREPSTSPCW